MRKVTVRDALFFVTIFYYFFLESRFALVIYQLSLILRWGFPVLLFLYAVGQIRRNGRTLTSYMLSVGIAVFLAAAPALITCIYPKESVMRLVSFIMVLLCQSIFWGSINDGASYDFLFQIICAIAAIFALGNFVFVILGKGIEDGRHTGMLGNSNTMGVYSGLALVAGGYLFRISRKFAGKILSLFIMAISVMLEIACGSRSALAVCILNIFALIFVLNSNKKLKKIVMLTLPVLLIFAVMLSGSVELGAISRFMEYGFGRSDIWKSGIEAFKAHAVFGVGYGLSLYYNTVFVGAAFHNSYLSYLVDVGMWGVMMLLIAVMPLANKIIKEFVQKDKVQCFSYMLIMLFDLALIAWGESYIFSIGSTEGFLFWLLVSSLVTYCGKKKRKILLM